MTPPPMLLLASLGLPVALCTSPCGVLQPWWYQRGSGASWANAIALSAAGDIFVAGGTWGSLDAAANAGEAPCTDDASFVDELGYRCHDWNGFACSDSTFRQYGYSDAGERAVLAACRSTCNLCQADIMLMKFSANGGDPQWTRLPLSSQSDSATRMVVDAGGSIVMAGYTKCEFDGVPGACNNAGTDVFVMQYSAAGVRSWTTIHGSEDLDFPAGLAVSNKGDIYIAGNTRGSLDGAMNMGGTDIFIMSFTSTGQLLWSKQRGTARDEGVLGLALNDDGEILVAGYTYGSFDGAINAGAADAFVMKCSASGTWQWTKQYGTADEDVANALAVNPDGDVFFAGYRGSFLTVTKLSADGVVQWSQQLPHDDRIVSGAHAIVASPHGDVYVAGTVNGTLDGETSAGKWDMVVVKYSAMGVLNWTHQGGTSEDDVARGLVMGAGGDIFVVGDLENRTTSSGGHFDIFLTKVVDECLTSTPTTTTLPYGAPSSTDDCEGRGRLVGLAIALVASALA